MSEIPRTMYDLKRGEVKAFSTWLVARGSEILKPSNEWELLRFRTAESDAGVIYKNKSGRLSYVGGADAAMRAYRSGGTWRARGKTTRRANVRHKIDALIARDGRRCFFCGGMFPPDGEPMADHGLALTMEHLLSVTHGGNNHLANLVLAHKRCNERAEHMSIAEKIILRDRLRTESGAGVLESGQ